MTDLRSTRALPLAAALPVAALGLALWAGCARADDDPPKLDVERTCASPGRIQAGISAQESRDGCLRSERAAGNDLKKRWDEFTPAAKAQCSKQSEAGGFPSYVETLTCLELATGTVPSQGSGGQGTGSGAATGAGKGTNLTAEPSASQRTNPIDVLEKKP